MSSIVTSLTGGGGAGDAFKPGSANVLNPATTDQAQQQYGNANVGLANQASFLQAVQAQNGLQNQSNTYNQLQGVANGTGPNPAQAQLAQATGANVAATNAALAGQRGAGANIGLQGRQAAMAGANTQQNAAGQAATLQASQSLNALNSMGSLATNQANQQANATNAYSSSAQGEQQNILGAIGAQNNANVGMQSNINTTGGALANTVSGQQANLLGQGMGAIGSVGQLFGGSSGAADASGGIGDIAGGAGDAGSGIEDVGTMFAAEGGQVPQRLDDGGDVGSTPLQQVGGPSTGPQSSVGKSFMQQEDSLGAPSEQQAAAPAASKGSSSGAGIGSMLGGAAAATQKVIGPALGQAYNYLAGGEFGSDLSAAGEGVAAVEADPAVDEGEEAIIAAAKGGRVPALLSPGERYLSPAQAIMAAKGKANPMKDGQKVPGKPKVAGAKNSYKNDTVKASLEPGGIVIPRSITQGKDAPSKAAAFVKAHMAKQGLK